jgi:hypothetical protein
MGPACHVSACGRRSAGGVYKRDNRGSLSLTRTRSPQPIKLREAGRATGMPVPEGGLIRCGLPAGKRIASLSVHKHVDDLCAMVPDLCVRSGNAGDSAAWPQSEQGLYLGEHQSRPVDTEKIEIIHMPRSKNDE